MKTSLRPQEEITEIYERYSDTVYRIAFLYLKNRPEAEDALQNVFLKLMGYRGEFQSEEHLKAYLIVTSKNVSKDMLKSYWRRNTVDLSHTSDAGQPDHSKQNETYRAVMSLPKKYRVPLYLYYYEGYSTGEISEILGINHSTVRSQLRAARKKLRLTIEEERENE